MLLMILNFISPGGTVLRDRPTARTSADRTSCILPGPVILLVRTLAWTSLSFKSQRSVQLSVTYWRGRSFCRTSSIRSSNSVPVRELHTELATARQRRSTKFNPVTSQCYSSLCTCTPSSQTTFDLDLPNLAVWAWSHSMIWFSPIE
jgi:hypothetical protein